MCHLHLKLCTPTGAAVLLLRQQTVLAVLDAQVNKPCQQHSRRTARQSEPIGRNEQRVRQQLKNEKRVAYRCEVLDGGRQWHISETPPTA